MSQQVVADGVVPTSHQAAGFEASPSPDNTAVVSSPFQVEASDTPDDQRSVENVGSNSGEPRNSERFDFGESGQSFERTAARLTAIVSNDSRQGVTRDELLEQGIEGPEADAIIVRLHENEILMIHFRRWIMCFSCFMILSMPAMLGIFVWMVAVWWSDKDTDCDVPLQTWVILTVTIVLYNVTLNRPTPSGSLIVRLCCRWTPDPENPEPMPLRVRLYSSTITIFIFLWNCIGLHWSRITGDYTYTNTEFPACKDVAPDLVLVVRVYSAFNLAFTVFMYVNMIGLAHLLRAAMRLGLIHTSNAAPKGAMEQNTTVITATDDPAFAEQPSCSICFEEFSNCTQEIRKTNGCGHVFHTQCLQRWLNVNRTCPLCRQDLGSVGSAARAQQGPSASSAQQPRAAAANGGEVPTVTVVAPQLPSTAECGERGEMVPPVPVQPSPYPGAASSSSASGHPRSSTPGGSSVPSLQPSTLGATSGATT